MTREAREAGSGTRPPPATSVLSAPSEHLLAHWPEPATLLTATERHRADCFRFERDRRDFTAAHILARVAAGGVLGMDPRDLTLVQKCGECGEAHGKPSFSEVPGLSVSLSHTRGYVSAAVGPGQVGVDTEGTASGVELDHTLISSVLATGELALLAETSDKRHAFVSLWVRKEATVKSGRGSLDDLSALDFSGLALADPSNSCASMRRWQGHYLLEWQDPEWDVVGAAVTTSPPDLATLRQGPGGPGFHDIPVVTNPPGDDDRYGARG